MSQINEQFLLLDLNPEDFGTHLQFIQSDS
jgi:hypothetical protein